jgi:hypothetical protein
MSKKTYQVGPIPYRGHKPGERFTAELDPDAERRALARGSIKLVKSENGGGKEKSNE